jgi:predicted nuclease of predicted toxin-antitoxin system
MIVTKDSDFNDVSVLRGFPPKIIWLHLGNCTTADVEQALRNNYETIETFAADTTSDVLELF